MSMLFKRLFDIACSALALIMFLPILVVVAVAIRIQMGSPILFSQKRPGLKGKPFKMIKFRTMRDPAPDGANGNSDSDRLTPLGRWLRSTSLDELPELWCVIAGDMSLVGPRPLLMQYLPLYSETQARRHLVRPGLTGWAQVNGRNSLSWEEKFDLDVWYVDNRSFALDLKILWLTVVKVLKREGISADGEATMSAFLGSQEKGSNS